MPTHHLDHANLSRMADSGRINATHIVGQPGGWAVQVEINHQEHVLTAQRSGNVRLFKKLETLVAYLLDLGIDHFEVDASTFDPGQMSTYQRPDRAQALKRAHEAAAYEAWFRDQVAESLEDTSPMMGDEEAERLFAAHRAAMTANKR
ncbi:hypothetical protein JET68_07000 [Pseudomonas monteilii]|uniref:hypothetical protein n=1 Tax=Pseudomonas TaxID=286 RepID=UPI0018E6BD25|nr:MULTISPECIES: hypothetical protein [Pseudomonas]MBI6918545.1 hypothetical protein [Pseudomonas monteilii]MCE0937472.1 hypothetical protein [Pseudomonas kurunegalensis]